MKRRSVAIVGGGAAGFFAAIRCAELAPGATINLFEKGPQFLSKVRISGGGRCNVTHACFDPRELATHYPRGGDALLGPFHAFQPRDTVAWFAARGVRLKTEPDGRMFPVTDSSQTIMDCLLEAARAGGVRLRLNCGVERATPLPQGGFSLEQVSGETFVCDRLMLATGGCRGAAGGQLAAAFGHTLEPPVPSLFTFRVPAPWVRALAGVSVEAQASVPGTGLHARGPVLCTHEGLSGPAILRLSAWGARVLHGLNYQFTLRINWLPDLDEQTVAGQLDARRAQHPARRIANAPLVSLPARLWEQLALAAGIPAETRWADLSRAARHRLARQLTATDLAVVGKTLNRDEFVTCGGVRLAEVNFKTLGSRLHPGLHFGGELLDIDGLTGGFNFQAAWTTGWLAGQALAAD